MPVFDQPKFNCFQGLCLFDWVRRFVALIWLLVASSVSQAGSIGFAVEFAGDEVSIVNKGSDAGYQLALWTLDASAKWRKMQVLSGNSNYLPPEGSLKALRGVTRGVKGLGRVDPLLIILYDQAGSHIVQVAWHQSPLLFPSPLVSQRDGRRLDILAGHSNGARIVTTYAIVDPYKGIAQLAHAFSPELVPPDPVHHVWADRSILSLDTGEGQMGGWLVHEFADGTQQLQVVTDGMVPGAEQVPVWLRWLRANSGTLAWVVAGLGGVLVFVGCLGLGRVRSVCLDLK
ncbi:MAG: hypothetical protein Q8R67_06240 [Rhodoferax sp.]|nr:hypothetical protein [Rhodoferax sp.]MDP3651264.1 hypothetical protein [Rhodoferax sp.]